MPDFSIHDLAQEVFDYIFQLASFEPETLVIVRHVNRYLGSLEMPFLHNSKYCINLSKCSVPPLLLQRSVGDLSNRKVGLCMSVPNQRLLKPFMVAECNVHGPQDLPYVPYANKITFHSEVHETIPAGPAAVESLIRYEQLQYFSWRGPTELPEDFVIKLVSNAKGLKTLRIMLQGYTIPRPLRQVKLPEGLRIFMSICNGYAGLCFDAPRSLHPTNLTSISTPVRFESQKQFQQFVTDTGTLFMSFYNNTV